MGDVVDHPTAERKMTAEEAKSPERMRELTRRRLEMAKTDPSKRGGRRRRSRLNDEEVQKLANEKAADALAGAKVQALRELENLLDSKDPSDRRFAIKTILEYTEGKPTQTVVEKQDGPRIIEYRTAALPAPFEPVELDELNKAT